MNDWEDRFERKPAGTTLRLLLVGFGIIVVLGVVGFFTGLIANPFVQTKRIIEKTIDADNVLYNYEWFKTQNQDVIAIDVKLAAAAKAKSDFETSAGARETWGFEDKQEWNRLNTIVLGLTGQRASMVSLYNARSEMANRDIFKSGDLPARLEQK